MFEASLGQPQHHENLTIFPILAEKERESPYGLMAEALALGILTIQEKDGGEVQPCRRSEGPRCPFKRSGCSSDRDLAQAQGAVWDQIREFEYNLGGTSDTGALDSVYESRRSELEHWVRAFPLLLGQIGLLAFQGKIPLGTDAVGSPSLYGKVHERVLTGSVLDAMEGRAGHGQSSGPVMSEDMPQPRIERATSVSAQRFIEDLKDDDRVGSTGDGHQAGTDGPGAQRAGPIARPSQRKRRF